MVELTINAKYIATKKERSNNWRLIELQMEDSRQYIKAKGVISCELVEGGMYILTGRMEHDAKFNNDVFKISSMRPVENPMVTFLYKKVRWVGKAVANKIYDELGATCLEKIKDDSSVLLKINGIGKHKAALIAESVRNIDMLEVGFDLQIYSFFDGEISPLQTQAVEAYCKEPDRKEKWAELQENPYRLIEIISRFSFRRADAMAKRAKIGDFDERRLHAAVVCAVHDMSNQYHSTCLPWKLAIYYAVKLLDPEDNFTIYDIQNYCLYHQAPPSTKVRMARYGTKVKSYLIMRWQQYRYDDPCFSFWQNKNTAYVYLRNSADMEIRCAYGLVERMRESTEVIWEGMTFENTRLTDEQKRAVAMALQYPFSIITGGPGTGKSTVVKTIIEQFSNDRIVLLAPTGKAAKRLTEITGRQAMTAQRYVLKAEYCGKGISGGMIIVDEASMIGIPMLDSLLKVAENNAIVLLGDTDQLPSIEPGNVLYELIHSDFFPVTTLTKCFRNQGAIAANVQLVREKGNLRNMLQDESFHIIRTTSDNAVLETLRIYSQMLDKYDFTQLLLTLPHSNNKNNRNYITTRDLNYLIQKSNLREKCKAGFCIGDRIIVKQNQYDVEIMNDDGEAYDQGIFNGDTGFVADFDDDGEILTIQLDDSGFVDIPYEEIGDTLELAYALTIHKAQGSEYNGVIVVADDPNFMSWRMLYTALSRGKKEVYLIDVDNTVEQIHDQKEKQRYEHLIERIA